MASEKKVAHLLQQQQQQQQQQSKSTTSFDIDIPADDPIIRELLEEASRLISENDTHKSTSNTNTSDNPNTEEKMHEYYELVSAFCAEQESHSELDGEEMICRADVLWLLQELKWRYEEILNSYLSDESSNKTSSQLDTSEWKTCMKGLVNILNKSIKATKSKDNHNTKDFQNEIPPLNQHDLESKLKEQKEYISQMQKDKQWIDEEKQRLKLSKDGTDARIRYLEGMLYSLQTQLNDSKQYQDSKIGCNGSPTRNNKAHVKKRSEKSPPPVYMRDLSHAVYDVDIGIKHDTTTSKTKTSTADITTTKDNSTELTMLREQVASLSASLAESETKRADLIEDFQMERKQYMTQYKQMSELLKEIMAGKQS